MTSPPPSRPGLLHCLVAASSPLHPLNSSEDLQLESVTLWLKELFRAKEAARSPGFEVFMCSWLQKAAG